MVKKIIYELTIEDLQSVATETIGRELTKSEIAQIVDEISDNLPWYDVICEVITRNFESKNETN